MRKFFVLLLILCLAGCLPSDQPETPGQVIAKFQRAGLEVGAYRPLQPQDYGLAPRLADEGMRFFIPSLCADCGGRVLAFSNLDDLLTTKAFYESLGKSNRAFASWIFVKGNILVQINADLPAAKARQYETALYSPQ